MYANFYFTAFLLLSSYRVYGLDLNSLLQRFRQYQTPPTATTTTTTTTTQPPTAYEETQTETVSSTPYSIEVSTTSQQLDSENATTSTLFIQSNTPSPEGEAMPTPQTPSPLSVSSMPGSIENSTSSSSESMESSSNESGEDTSVDIDKCSMHRSIGEFCDSYDGLEKVFGERPIFCDVVHSLFSKDILDKLESCDPGRWCLGRYSLEDLWTTDYVFNETVRQALCDVSADICFEYVATAFQDCDSYNMLTFYRLATEFLCSMKQYDVSDDCVRNTLMMQYVTISDLSDKKEMEDAVEVELDNDCKTSDANMAEQFQCLQRACPPSSMDAFYRFKPWQWFILDMDYIITNCPFDGTCNLTNTMSLDSDDIMDTTTAFFESFATSNTDSTLPDVTEQEGVFLDNKHRGTLEESHRMYLNNLEIVVGVTVSSTIVIMGMVLFVFLYIRRWRTTTRALDREGYTKLINDE